MDNKSLAEDGEDIGLSTETDPNFFLLNIYFCVNQYVIIVKKNQIQWQILNMMLKYLISHSMKDTKDELF